MYEEQLKQIADAMTRLAAAAERQNELQAAREAGFLKFAEIMDKVAKNIGYGPFGPMMTDPASGAN